MYHVIQYNYGSHFYKICDFLDNGYTRQSNLPVWLKTRWEYVNHNSIFKFDSTHQVFIWFKGHEIVALVVSEYLLSEVYIMTNFRDEFLYRMITEHLIDVYEERPLYVCYLQNDKVLKTELEKSGFKDTQRVECELCFSSQENISARRKNFNFLMRNVVSEDINDIAAVMFDSFPQKDDSNKIVVKRNLKHLFKSIAFNSETHFVAENKNGEIIAYCGFWENEHKKYAMIEPLAVRKDFSNMGVAIQLIYFGIEQMMQRGCTDIYITIDNLFYRRIGFQQVTNRNFAVLIEE